MSNKIDILKSIDYNGQLTQTSAEVFFDSIRVSRTDRTTLEQYLGTHSATEVNKALNPGYATIMEWGDGNPAGDDRTGKFVSLVPGEKKIKIAGEDDTIYGVSTNKAAFIENYSDIAGTTQTLVSLFGTVTVICKDGYTEEDLNAGIKVTVSATGNAVKSGTEFGYTVIDVVDANHLLIALLPNIDSLDRIGKKLLDIISRYPDIVSIAVDNDELTISVEGDEDTVTEPSEDGTDTTTTDSTVENEPVEETPIETPSDDEYVEGEFSGDPVEEQPDPDTGEVTE